MSAYETMSFHPETERLILRPWAESDAAEFRALLSERGNGTPTVEHARTLYGIPGAKRRPDANWCKRTGSCPFGDRREDAERRG